MKELLLNILATVITLAGLTLMITSLGLDGLLCVILILAIAFAGCGIFGWALARVCNMIASRKR